MIRAARLCAVLLLAAAAAVPAAADQTGGAQFVINEIDYDQPGTDTLEFIEIKNVGASAGSLSGYTVRFVNGGANPPTTYRTVTLPNVTLAAGDYFVLCSRACNMPTPADCDMDLTPDTNLIENGSPDAVAIMFGTTVIDTVSYEGNTTGYTEGSGERLLDDAAVVHRSIARFPDGVDTQQNDVDLSARCATPGAANVSASSGCFPAGAGREIWDIQGTGLASALVSCRITTRDNVVTAVAADGFYIQTPDARSDGDPQTSDGIFVFTSTAPTVSAGDLVSVNGTVQEFFQFTELSDNPLVMVSSSGQPMPSVVPFNSTTPSPNQPQPATEMERFEAMLVSAVVGVVSAPSDQFGDAAMVAKTGRAFRERGILFPGLPGLPVWDGNPELFEIDPDGVGQPDQPLHGGSPVATGGVLTYAFGDYQILPRVLQVTPVPLPVAVPARQPGEITVATQNLRQLYDTFDDPNKDDIVVTAAAYNDKLAKLSRQVREVLGAPEILVVQEAENLAVLQDLAARIQADSGPAYTPYLMEGNDVSGIDIGVMVRAPVAVNSVEQFGKDDTFTFNGQTALLHDRPPLIVQGSAGSATGTLIAVHLRSLSGIDGTDGPRVREKRHQQGLRLSQHIQTLQNATPNIRLIVTGDFNAFQFTDGYVDVMGQITGNPDPAGSLIPATDEVNPDLTNQVMTLPATQRYSFVFDGSAQALDHTLTSLALEPYVRRAAFGRSNADAAVSWETNAGTALRSSDHDGFVVYLGPPPAN